MTEYMTNLFWSWGFFWSNLGLWSKLNQFTGSWCENVWEPLTNRVYHYNCIFLQAPPHTHTHAHIEDTSSACCLLVWHQIPFIRALQRLQNPPDELNHCLCLFTWYVTYKCTKYKTFKDKCFTQKEENFLSNQSKCYGFQLRCNCKV